jgi:hypothetical protein
MKNLKTDLLYIFCIIFMGCQNTKVFEIKTYPDGGGVNDLQIVNVDTDRIKHECYFMNAEAENNWRHQYVMYILNDENHVIPVLFPTNQGDVECLAHLKKVEKIFKYEAKVSMCLRTEYKRDLMKKDVQDFGKLGKYVNGYDPLTFDSICNSKDCYSINETWTNTCPGFEKNFRK